MLLDFKPGPKAKSPSREMFELRKGPAVDKRGGWDTQNHSLTLW